MKIAVLVMSILVMCICRGSISEENNPDPDPRHHKQCRFPKGNHGSVHTNGCIKSTCTNGKWKPKVRTDICCYNQKVHKPNTVLDTIVSADNCSSTTIRCGAVGQLEFNHKSCAVPATKQQVEQLEMNLEHQIEQIESLTETCGKQNYEIYKTVKEVDKKILNMNDSIGNNVDDLKNTTTRQSEELSDKVNDVVHKIENNKITNENHVIYFTRKLENQTEEIQEMKNNLDNLTQMVKENIAGQNKISLKMMRKIMNLTKLMEKHAEEKTTAITNNTATTTTEATTTNPTTTTASTTTPTTNPTTTTESTTTPTTNPTTTTESTTSPTTNSTTTTESTTTPTTNPTTTTESTTTPTTNPTTTSEATTTPTTNPTTTTESTTTPTTNPTTTSEATTTPTDNPTTTTEAKTTPTTMVEGILITGGNGDHTSTELFLPHTGKTCRLQSLPDDRRMHSLAALGNKAILCGGGFGSSVTSCLQFLPTSSTGTWVNYTTLAQGRVGHTSHVFNDTMILLGGTDHYVYDFEYDYFDMEDDSPGTAEIIPNGHKYNLQNDTIGACGIPDQSSTILTGGYYDDPDYYYDWELYTITSGVPRSNLKKVERYNMQGFVENLPDLATGRSFHGCGSYINNLNTKVLVVAGGRGNDWALFSSTELLIVGATSWHSGESLPRTLAYHTPVNMGAYLLIFGGTDDWRGRRGEVLKFNGSWTEVGMKKNEDFKAGATKMMITTDRPGKQLDITACN